MENIKLIDFDLFSGWKDMPRGNKKRFNDNYTRKGALSLAKRRLERAYGMKGESNFSADELDELRQIFEFYDIDSSKTMDLSELNMALRALGYNASEEAVHDLASLMDVDGDMTMDFSEFCMIVEFMREEKGVEEELRGAFRCIDMNGDGYVTADELLELLMTQGNTMSLKEASELIRFADKNGDGRLNYEEFMRIMLRGRNTSRSTTFYSTASCSLNSLNSKDALKAENTKKFARQPSIDDVTPILPESFSSNFENVEDLSKQSVSLKAVGATSLSNIHFTTIAKETDGQSPNEEVEDVLNLDSDEHTQDKGANGKRMAQLQSQTNCENTTSNSINVVGPRNGKVLGSVVLETRT